MHCDKYMFPQPGVRSEYHGHMLYCHFLEVDGIRVGVQELFGRHHIGKLMVLKDTIQELLKLLLALDDELSVYGRALFLA